MLGCFELALERALEESRRDLDGNEVAGDIASLRKEIASSWYPHSLSRRCHCNCTVAQWVGICTVLDARGREFATVHDIPMERIVIRSVARSIAESPEIWPVHVTYSELYDAVTRLLDACEYWMPADQRSRDAYLLAELQHPC